MLEIARTVVGDYLGIRESDDALIVCDEERLKIADALAVAADEQKARAVVIVITEAFRLTQSVTEPLIGKSLKEMLKKVDVAILCLANIDAELGFRKFFLRAIRKSPIRVANLPGITENTFLNALRAPGLRKIERLGNAFARLFGGGKQVRVTSPKGTDIHFSLYGWKRPPEISTGYLLRPSIWGNLPGAEFYVPPVAGSAEGKVVIDITIDQDHKVKNPVEFYVQNGRVERPSISSKDEEAKRLLLNCLSKENGDAICEFGLGLNNEIRRVTGITLIDEKKYKTAHFALGDNIEFGGEIKSDVHYDMVFNRPSVWIDGELIVDKGIPTFTSRALKNSYRYFEGRLKASTLVRATPWATCVRQDGYLAQLWTGGANRMHAFILGDLRTSRLAEKIWTAISYSGSSIENIVSRTKIDERAVKKVVEFLVFHGVLETFRKPSAKERRGVEKMGRKKDAGEKIELLGNLAHKIPMAGNAKASTLRRSTGQKVGQI